MFKSTSTSLIRLFGLFTIIYGISQIVSGAQLRQTGDTAHKIVAQTADAGDWSADGSAQGGE